MGDTTPPVPFQFSTPFQVQESLKALAAFEGLSACKQCRLLYFSPTPIFLWKKKKETSKRERASTEFVKKSKESKCENPVLHISSDWQPGDKGFPGNAKCFVPFQSFPGFR